MLRKITTKLPVLLILGFVICLFAFSISPLQAQDIEPPTTVTIAGTIQPQLGCSGDWQPACEAAFLTYDATLDLWTATWQLTAGNYEYKAALNGSWDDNFGLLAEYYGPNIPLSVPEDMAVTFTYDHNTGLVTDSINNHQLDGPAVALLQVANPDFVTIPGTIQEQLGCSGNWQPECQATFLTLDEEDDVWQGGFILAAGDYEYKVAIDQSWGENYGGRADRDGPNVSLPVPADDTPVRFYYDHKTNWVADSLNSVIATVTGTFQDEAGCATDNDPGCLRSWLQDPDGDGIYTALVSAEPGEYEAVVAIDESLDEIYGQDGAAGGPPYTFTVSDDVAALFFSYDAENHMLSISTAGPPKGDINARRAHWVTRDTIAWDVDPAAVDFTLYYDLNGELSLGSSGVSAENEIPLALDPNGLSSEILAKFPHLAGFAALKIGAEGLRQVRTTLKGQLAVAARDVEGSTVDAAGLQISGVLDDMYPYDGPLGVGYQKGVPFLTLWAPTARSVTLHLFDGASQERASQTHPLRLDPDTGAWSISGQPTWTGKYYLYEVEVFVPSEGRVVRNLVTDPYSASLSMNSRRSQIVDITDGALKPAGWDQLTKPELVSPADIVLYELHLRDFSARDETVPEERRGTYLAFTEPDADGMSHLRALAEAGLTHLHLLPTFDIATINEDKSSWESIGFEQLEAFPADSNEQQALLNPLRDTDGFNWGYDPFHYNLPEGSYSTDPDGPGRILEFRQMVQAINQAGLRLVVDVVYNHTNASGQSDRSVLDRIVPGYYHRLDAEGRVATSTCCANTATEHNMMRRLMLDSVVHWARQYKVDGFRFDLMGHHMVADMQAIRQALDALTLEQDGVDGAKIYIYGEGWDFGEVAGGARGVNATQLNVGGLGIGTFNDRLRDAVRGGNPFSGYQEQGFATGLFTDPNELEVRDEATQRAALLQLTDQIRVGLAGNLADYRFINAAGEEITGRQVDYNGSPAGYTLSPLEHIAYISAHDNETWFDAIQAKAPLATSMNDRVKMQNLGLSLVMYSQGLPFFHAGSEMLRSKSFDRDSFNSGDWFNALDWTYQRNNWGIGLPPAEKNQDNWEIMAPLLADPTLAPAPEHIQANLNQFRRMLRVRRSSPLFRLETAEHVQTRLAFHNTGPAQLPGLIVLSLSDVPPVSDLDPAVDMILVLFNAAPGRQSFQLPPELAAVPFQLHPEQAVLSDSTLRGELVDGVVHLPGRSTTVLVAPQGSVMLPQAELVTPVEDDQALSAAETTSQVADDQQAVSAAGGNLVPLLLVFFSLAAAVVTYFLYRGRRLG